MLEADFLSSFCRYGKLAPGSARCQTYISVVTDPFDDIFPVLSNRPFYNSEAGWDVLFNCTLDPINGTNKSLLGEVKCALGKYKDEPHFDLWIHFDQVSVKAKSSPTCS